MAEYVFLLKIALINIRKNKLLWISKSISSLFCFYFALFMIGTYGGGQTFVRERYNFKNADSLEMYVAEDVKMLPKNPEAAAHFIIYAQNDQVLFEGNFLAEVGISLTDKGYGELFEGFCEQGQYISDTESECVIGNAIAEKYRICLSDEISIGSRNYTVCGITANAGYRNTILLCDPRESEAGCPQIYISTSELYGTGLRFKGKEIQKYFSSMTDMSDIIPIAAVCAAMLVFSAINVLNLTIINAKKSALMISIHRSLGASRKELFAMRFAENSVINILMFSVALIFILMSERIVLMIFSTTLEFSAPGITSAFAAAMLMSLIYTLGAPKKEGVCSI